MASLMSQLARCLRRYNPENMSVLADMLEERELFESARKIRNASHYSMFDELVTVINRTRLKCRSDYHVPSAWEHERFDKRFRKWVGKIGQIGAPYTGSDVYHGGRFEITTMDMVSAYPNSGITPLAPYRSGPRLPQDQLSNLVLESEIDSQGTCPECRALVGYQHIRWCSHA